MVPVSISNKIKVARQVTLRKAVAKVLCRQFYSTPFLWQYLSLIPFAAEFGELFILLLVYLLVVFDREIRKKDVKRTS